MTTDTDTNTDTDPVCGNCDTNVEESYQFCPECGQPLQMAGAEERDPFKDPSPDDLLAAALQAYREDDLVAASRHTDNAREALMDDRAGGLDLEGIEEQLAQALDVDTDELPDPEEGPAHAPRRPPSRGAVHLDDVPLYLRQDLKDNFAALRIVIEPQDRDGHHYQIRYEKPESESKLGEM